MPKESEGLWMLGPKSLRDKSAARGGWAGMALPAVAHDLLIPKESEGLRKLGPENLCDKSAAREGGRDGSAHRGTGLTYPERILKTY